MKLGFRSARTTPFFRPSALVAPACLAGCAAALQTPPDDPQVLAAGLHERLDALQRQPEPASDEGIESLERTLRERREKRARAVVAAGVAEALLPTPAAAASVATAAASAPARTAGALPPPHAVAQAPLTPMSRTPESQMPLDELYARARQLEVQRQVAPATGTYREASRRGHAPSPQRLMEIHADGAPGLARDDRVAVFFKERAVQRGVSFDPGWRR